MILFSGRCVDVYVLPSLCDQEGGCKKDTGTFGGSLEQRVGGIITFCLTVLALPPLVKLSCVAFVIGLIYNNKNVSLLSQF